MAAPAGPARPRPTGSRWAKKSWRSRAPIWGYPPPNFGSIPQAYAVLSQAAAAGAQRRAAWQTLLSGYAAAYPELAAEFERTLHGELPSDWRNAPMPAFEKPVATRVASGQVLNAFATVAPELLGGSADLTGSNKTDLKGVADIQKGAFDGRYLRFGVREHGMGAIMNGMALHGGVIPYGGTFLVFSDYMRPSIRLAALMRQRVIYVFTHDSIGLGEDGPTHQPVEHLAALRTIPNLVVFRPADAWETAVGWQVAIARRDGPTALALTRQNLPVLERDATAGAAQGGYVLADADNPQVILLGSGSEVHIALAAQQLLAAQGIAARVVSMPSWELFEQQSPAYKAAVLPPDLTARVAIEAGVSFGWERYVGAAGLTLAIDRFGASAPYERIYAELGLTPEALAAAALKLVEGE
jgi:transketolase